MGHRRRCGRQGLRATEADSEVGDLEAVEEGKGFAFTALQVKREGRPGAGAMALVDILLMRTGFEEAEIADLFNLGMVAEELADFLRAFTGPIHPQFERFEA